MQVLLRSIIALALFVCAVWISLAAAYSAVLPEYLRIPLALLYFALVLLGNIGQLFLPPPILRANKLILLVLGGAFFYLYLSLQPRLDRDWAADVARLPWVEQDGSTFRIHNIRDFHYLSEAAFEENYNTREFDLNDLKSVDLITSHWGSEHIAHVMISFGFRDGSYITFSLEARREVGESYSAIAGFFRRYELIVVAAEERDVIALRTDVRQPNEDVYLWPIDIADRKAKVLFLRYVQFLDSLHKKPRFYNAATTNCATGVLDLAANLDVNLRYSWKIILSGHAPSFLYDIGSLDHSVSFVDLKARSRINDKAHAALRQPEGFSQRIRHYYRAG